MQLIRGSWAGLIGLCAAALISLVSVGCNDGGAAPPSLTGGAGGGGGQAGAGGGGGQAGAGLTVTPVTVSAATTARTTRTTSWSVNYWMWSPTYGDALPGTEAQVAALTPTYLRVGGYNNDANTPDTFDNGQLDTMVTYARAIGAEPILQVPHLAADSTGTQATAANAAAMVQYANLTKGYAIKYFSVGNEPDLYDSSGLPSNSAMPAIPGYTPTQYCASVTSYVTAMKAVDPTIKIVGPDLAYKYQAGGDLSSDWLTPILQMCGDQFDVISIHRYPFEAAMATLPAAAGDPVTFRQVMTSVLGILQTTGQGAKPLALTEMNIAYDSTGCVLEASPGTVGSALWMADILGSAIELNLWTSAVWDISDSDDWSLGLIGLPPGHVARPSYYAYALYAAHVGPTVLPSPSGLPAGVSAYASRNSADSATELIIVNWNEAPVALQVQVTGLATAPAAPTYRLPGVSMAAVEIQDSGNSTAWLYGEDERRAAVGPQSIAQGTAPASGVDGGAGAAPAGRTVGDNCPAADAGVVCSSSAPSTPVITTGGAMHTAAPLLTFGGNAWGSYTYAAAGQTAPTAALSNDGNGIQISGGFVSPVTAGANYEGVGLYYNNSGCLDVTAYTGIQFDFSGTLGGCAIQLGASYSGDASESGNPMRGACAGTSSTCYGPSYDVTTEALAVTSSSPTIKVPFNLLSGGMPISTLDPRSIITVQWQLSGPLGGSDGGACSANFTVENVKFY
jgi:hypothetical protein